MASAMAIGAAAAGAGEFRTGSDGSGRERSSRHSRWPDRCRASRTQLRV